MKKLLLASLVALLPAAGFAAENALSYAYPVAPQNLPQPDPNQKHQAKGTKTGMQLTFREINNAFGPPDWFPDEHPSMPDWHELLDPRRVLLAEDLVGTTAVRRRRPVRMARALGLGAGRLAGGGALLRRGRLGVRRRCRRGAHRLPALV